VSSKNLHPPGPQNGTAFGDRLFKVLSKVNKGQPYMTGVFIRKFGHKHREHHVRHREKAAICNPRRKASNEPPQHTQLP
jgi:hypothetical protein